MFGARGRIGAIVPANNATIEPELWPHLPPDTVLFATRVLARGNLTPAAVEAMESHVDRAVDELVATGVDVIAYADMVTTFIMAPGWNERRSAEIAAHTRVPVVTCWLALQAALEALGVRRFALGTPYPAPVHALCRPFFEQAGYQITGEATLDILRMTDVPKVTPAELHGLVDRLDRSGAEAVVLLATDLPTFAAIAALERATGLPVLTSNQTLLWRALRLCRNEARIAGLGRLFA